MPEQPVPRPPAEPATRAERQALHERTASQCPGLVGLSVDDARTVGRQRGLFLRVIVEDADGWHTQDLRIDRITAYARNGVITRAVVA